MRHSMTIVYHKFAWRSSKCAPDQGQTVQGGYTGAWRVEGVGQIAALAVAGDWLAVAEVAALLGLPESNSPALEGALGMVEGSYLQPCKLLTLDLQQNTQVEACKVSMMAVAGEHAFGASQGSSTYSTYLASKQGRWWKAHA